MRVALASDHAGFRYKEILLEELRAQGHEVADLGTDSTESVDDHFGLPRVSGLWDDLDPGEGGTVSWKQFGDRVAVTWENVPDERDPRWEHELREILSSSLSGNILRIAKAQTK